jgi:hypothetical protein
MDFSNKKGARIDFHLNHQVKEMIERAAAA